MTPAELQAIRARNEAEEWGDPQQINTDVADLLYHVDTLTDRLEAVRELHGPSPASDYGEEGRFGDTQLCQECTIPERDLYEYHPCPTIRALDGDDS